MRATVLIWIFLMGIIIGMYLGDIIRAFHITPEVTKAVKLDLCAETQGKYDFCVAVTNWEVKR